MKPPVKRVTVGLPVAGSGTELVWMEMHCGFPTILPSDGEKHTALFTPTVGVHSISAQYVSCIVSPFRAGLLPQDRSAHRRCVRVAPSGMAPVFIIVIVS